MGAADADGCVVSFIQSVFWEFGSGLTCEDTGVFFQNRGAGFSLSPGPNELGPFRRPFHTLNPALAQLNDGRVMAYGTMGGEGQPQTQAAVFTRHVLYGQDLQAAVTAPRWLLGRTWGDATTTLKLEDRFDPALVAELKAAGHEVEAIPAFSDLAGHAGAVVLHPGGLVEAASDPRADGAALAI
jgi:oxamate amidohydrolase